MASSAPKLHELVEPIWEQQQGEKSVWHSRFMRFVLLGTGRMLSRVYAIERAEADGLDKPKTYNAIPHSWDMQSRQWHWRERAAAWDGEQRREDMRRDKEERDRVRDRHIQGGMLLQNAAMLGLTMEKKVVLPNGQSIIERVPRPIESPAQALHAYRVGIDIERQARGLPDMVIKYAELPEDELRREFDRIVAEEARLISGRRSQEDQAQYDTDEEE